jgi:N-methylhydantoinase B
LLIYPDSPEARELPSKITLPLKPGDVVSVQTPGGGGCEEAWRRPAEEVVADVALGKMSVERARQVYGVVLAPGTLDIDAPATAEARARLACTVREKTDA